MVFLKAAKQYKKTVKVNLSRTSSSWAPLPLSPFPPPPPQNEGRIRKKKRIILTLWMWIKLEIFWRNKFCEQLIFLRENTEKNQCVSTASSTSLWKCTYRNRKRKDCYKWKQTLKFVFHSREEMKYRNIL